MTERSRGIIVTGAHRTIRTLTQDEGPFEGDLVTRAGGVVVRVDAERMRGWAGWTFSGAEHVAAPLDVALTADGQDVLLPWCVRTVRTALAQAGEAGGISHGEAVTLAVSVLRGVLELEGRLTESGRGRRGDGDPGEVRDGGAGDEPHGSWWLTDEARPVFVIAPVGGWCAEGSPVATGEQLLRDLEGRIEDRAFRRVLARLAEALRDPRRLRAEAARWEGELLEIAAPRPVRLIADEFAAAHGEEESVLPVPPRYQHPPRRRELRPAGRAVGATRRTWSPGRGAGGAAGRIRALQGAVGHAYERIREMRAAGGAARRRLRGAPSEPTRRPERLERPVRGRRWRGPVVLAVAAAAAITVTGAMWPSDPGGSDAGRTSRAAEIMLSGSESPSPGARVGAAPAGGGQSGAPDPPQAPAASSLADAEAAGGELIAAARKCEAAPQPACAEVWDGGTATSRALRPAPQPAELIEDYGGIAALRSGSGPEAQMIVIIRRNAEWRIRDVYDIADPPSEGAEPP